ncbi:beta-lactamase-like protein [Vararia minispora EC-137]|uniref:Beta-lactamase-like protein n=1 Tax=Vararia minispora EC-137 TaxID=1314806 RepID=A0ACB8QM84_9AGAM|nr:beta-lactamase-like protein [Vararia minispora EC-137]
MNATHAIPTTSSADDIELIFLGTGTSGSVPNLSCITAPPDTPPCRTCLSTLTPEGKKNVRRNTSVVLRVPGSDGKRRTILIDAGKNFQAAALEWFPKYGLRKIDAVLITHAHADAMNGLDDLRAWTLRGVIQDYIPIYVSRTTFDEVQRAFPYMVAKERASGGGDVRASRLPVPEFKWHIFEDAQPIVLEESGIEIMPLPTTNPPSPARASPTRDLESKSTPSPPPIQPYICHAFLVQKSVLYMADVSHITEDTWALLGRANDAAPVSELAVAVVDCLRPVAHTSHFGIREAVSAARRLRSTRTYLTGFGHEISHDEYARVCEVVGGLPSANLSLTSGERKCLDLVEEGRPVWLRPAHDGLRMWARKDGSVVDETYDV